MDIRGGWHHAEVSGGSYLASLASDTIKKKAGAGKALAFFFRGVERGARMNNVKGSVYGAVADILGEVE